MVKSYFCRKESFISCFWKERKELSATEMFANETLYPRDDEGNPLDHFRDINETIPFITVLLSLFSSSFGMSKFFLFGPIRFLSNKVTSNGLFSVPFLCLCLINSMFGFRIVCVESALLQLIDTKYLIMRQHQFKQ